MDQVDDLDDLDDLDDVDEEGEEDDEDCKDDGGECEEKDDDTLIWQGLSNGVIYLIFDVFYVTHDA